MFDALTSVRPYKSAWSVGEAVTEVELCSGGHFDPQPHDFKNWESTLHFLSIAKEAKEQSNGKNSSY